MNNIYGYIAIFCFCFCIGAIVMYGYLRWSDRDVKIYHPRYKPPTPEEIVIVLHVIRMSSLLSRHEKECVEQAIRIIEKVIELVGEDEE